MSLICNYQQINESRKWTSVVANIIKKSQPDIMCLPIKEHRIFILTKGRELESAQGLNPAPNPQETEDSGTYWMHHKDAISKIITVENSIGQWFSMCGPRPAAPTSPGNLLEKQILKPHSDLLNQKFMKGGPTICIVMSWCRLMFESHCYRPIVQGSWIEAKGKERVRREAID